MTYAQWFDTHAKKHRTIVEKLRRQSFDEAQIIAYFDFEHMCEAEPDFCPLYADKTKCHAMPVLNCYLCACPYFRFSDAGIAKEADGTVLYSYCAVDAKDGRPMRFGDAVHHDCSGCTLPHRTGFVRKHFDDDWKTVMAACEVPVDSGSSPE